MAFKSCVAVLAAIALAGLLTACAQAPTLQVNAPRSRFDAGAPRSCAFDPLERQAADPTRGALEARVAQRLAAYRFDPMAAAQARYLVSLAYASRPVALIVNGPSSTESDPRGESGGLLERLGIRQPSYRHTLSVRIVERASGAEVYRAGVQTIDRNPRFDASLPMLVDSVLARFPLEEGGVWQVMPGTTAGAPPTLRTEPAPPASGVPR